MKRKKWVAIITGAISVAIAVAYLILVQFLDFRGEMVPAPVSLEDLSTITNILINKWCLG